jgi:hypothetical protein
MNGLKLAGSSGLFSNNLVISTPRNPIRIKPANTIKVFLLNIIFNLILQNK